ncbi:MAG: hypothetical protein GTN62_04945 [Gemmatimonadales bacterium]|nr:hypothetical protein [Gemmatimonadales bacterium]NIN10802.1 hypothetical protein [Gemmatimonadales bacterium]NIN49446.1 hypothetical protein [Gemmatimonadales bacterium]NIP06910.1 hypothetical protein [Gemmatimonadales bacterium]NIR02846.1 hypothetical protein [Gemmatimonadales bacterium]
MNRQFSAVTRVLGLTYSLGLLASSVAVAQVDPSIFEGMKARNIGPSGMSGRISAIDAVNANPNIVYVGAATGGLWKSTTGGVTWEPVMDSLPASSVGAVAIFQAAPDIVWVGTGERNRRNSAGVGTGVYKTMDGGKTWQLLGLENTGAIDAIILHPSDPNIAFVGALGSTWTESEDRGVYKTTDGGKTWSKVLYVNQRTGAGDLVMDPSNPNHLLAAMWEHRRWPWFFKSGGDGSGLYSTYDGGETWKELTSDDGLPEGELGRIGLDYARGDPDVVYAVTEAKRSVMMRSDDGGDTWRVVNRERGIAQRPFYYAQVRVDPTNENRVYNVHGTIDLSEDGGKNFRTLLPFARVHVDHHAFWVGPEGKILYDGNDGGVYISRDRGTSWRFVENLPLAQFYHINVDMDTPFNVLGGLQDNGSWKGPSQALHNGGIRYYDWREVGFGDGFATLSDPNNARYGYAMSQGGNLRRFDNETGDQLSIRPPHPEGAHLRFNWNAGIAIDPFDGAVYYGSQFVHKTSDMGGSWTIISPDLTTNDPEKQKQRETGGLTIDNSTAENHTTIMTIAPSPVEQGVIWVGTDDGNVQLTRDGGATWTNVVDRIRDVPENTWVPHIEPSKFDGGTAFVVFDDHRRGNNTPYLFKTENYGRSWESLVTDDIEAFNFVHAIEQDPVNGNLLFLGTEYGMYVSLNGGEKWHLWRHGLPRAPARAVIVHPRDHDLVIGTHGRSAYVLDDVRPLRALADDPAIVDRPLHLFEIPPAIQWNIAQVHGMRFTADAMFKGDNRPYGALLTYYVQAGGGGGSSGSGDSDGEDDAKAKIQVLDGSGEVIRTFQGPAKQGINRTAWNLRRDGFKQLGGDDTPAEFLPPGPAALPGEYTVRVIVGSDTASRAVSFSSDPRFDVTIAERRAKLDVIMRAGQLQETAVEAVERLRKAEKGIDEVLERLKQKDDSSSKALTAAGDSLKKRLDAVEEDFIGPQDIQGFTGDPNAVLSKIGLAMGQLASSQWEAPTPAHMIFLRQAEHRLQEALPAVNTALTEDVAAFRRAVVAAGVEVFPAVEGMTMDWRKEN